MSKNISNSTEKILHSMSGTYRSFAKFLTTLALSITIISQPAVANQNGTAPVTIEASNSLEWDQTRGVYIAIGDAFVKQIDSTLAGDKILVHYDLKSKTRNLQQVTAVGSIVYNDGKNVARGAKLDYYIINKTYVLGGPKASVSGPKGTMTADQTITYDGANPANKRIIGIGNAIFKGTDGRVVGGDRVLTFLNAEGAIVTIESYGNAMVVTPKGITARSNNLNYDANSDKAALFGNVEITDKNNTLRGARAEVEFSKEISRLLSDDSGKRVTGVLVSE
jgi:lipopolysaccharide export system protein LptA